MSEVEDKKIQIAVYVEPEAKNDMEEFFFEKRIKKFQDAYREIMRLGFIEFKKKGGKISG